MEPSADDRTPSEYTSAYASSNTAVPGNAAGHTEPAVPEPAPVYTAPAATAVPQAVYASPASKKQSKGWIAAIAIVAVICLTFLITALSCNSMVVSAMSGGLSSSGSDDMASSGPVIGVIEIDGTIQYDGTTSSPEGLKAQLDRAEADKSIQGVILHVNSGGGTATAGEEMAKYVKDFTKPIVVSTAATCASAAYEISSQADYIFTDKTSMVGAIGVFMQITDLSGLYDMLGISVETIKSADAKDAGSGTRPLTEEERAWYQDMVDQINLDFIETVAEGRGMDVEEVERLATGLPFTGMDAVENGLADEIGDIDDATAYLSDFLGFSEPLRTVKLAQTQSDLSRLIDILGESGQTASESVAVKLLAGLEDGTDAF